MVELSGNATLAIIAGMLHEITVRHTAFVFKERRPVSKADYEKLMRSYGRLMQLLRSGDGAAAEAHWRKHLDTARELLLKGLEDRQGPRRDGLDRTRGLGTTVRELPAHCRGVPLVGPDREPRGSIHQSVFRLPLHRQQPVPPAARITVGSDMIDR